LQILDFCFPIADVTEQPDQPTTAQDKTKGRAFSQLSDRHKAFVAAYLRLFNGTKAAIEAGYVETDARNYASTLLANPSIAAAVSEQLDKMGITEERIKSEYAEMAFDSDVADLQDVLQGMNLKQARAAGVKTKRIRKIKITRRVVGHGEDAYEVEDVSLEMHDPKGALDSLAKVKGMMTEKLQVTGTLGSTVSVDDAAAVAAGAAIGRTREKPPESGQ
jgi:phage terminase small subunit